MYEVLTSIGNSHRSEANNFVEEDRELFVDFFLL